MAKERRLSTRVLLVCAAIAVATGLISALAGLLSGATILLAPALYGLVLTAHLLPGIVAQDVLRQPWVGLLTHLLAALVASATQPAFIASYLLAVVIMGGVQEGWAAIGRYRRWDLPWFLIGGAILGVVLGVSAGLPIGLKHFAGWGVVLAIVLTVAGAVAWTLVGLGIGRALRRAGVVRTRA